MATTLARVLIAADVAGEAAERAWPATLLQPGTARLALGMPLAVGSVAGVKAVAGSLLNDLGVAASVVAVAGGVLGVCQAATRIYNRTAGSRCDLARRLNGLAAGVTLRYVEERSGTPAFARTIVLPCQPPDEAARPQMRMLRDIALAGAGTSATAGNSQPATGRALARGGAPRGGNRSGNWCTGRSTRGSRFSSTRTMRSSGSRSPLPIRGSSSRSRT
jgi:hypothetical protein